MLYLQDIVPCGSPQMSKRSLGSFSSREGTPGPPIPPMRNGNPYSNWEGKHHPEPCHRQPPPHELPPPVSMVILIELISICLLV